MPKLSIIIPAYNEEKTIDIVLQRVTSLDFGIWHKEIIVIDDCSIDGTWKILQKWSTQLKLFHLNKNSGKTAALRRGFLEATGDYIVIQDADLEYDPADLLTMLKEVEKNQYPVVYGSRRLNHKSHYSYLTYFWGANFLTWLTNVLYQQKLTDVETCYKLIRTDLLKKIDIVSSNYVFENEVTAKLSRLGIKIIEIPISYAPRSKEEGKKINWRHGLEALWATFKFRF